jgi:hypothetical protein
MSDFSHDMVWFVDAVSNQVVCASSSATFIAIVLAYLFSSSLIRLFVLSRILLLYAWWRSRF